MFDTVAYYQSVTGVVAGQAINALADSRHTVSGTHVTVPSVFRNLCMGWYTLSNATDVIQSAQPQAPSMKARFAMYPDVSNVKIIAAGSAYTPSFPQNVESWMDAPIPLDVSENLDAWVMSSSTTAADLTSAVHLLGDGVYTLVDPKTKMSPYQGMPVYKIKFTTATAGVANTWTGQVLAASQSLPAGTYAVIGQKAITPTGKWNRLVNLFNPSGAQGNPGSPVFLNEGSPDIDLNGCKIFRSGNGGVQGFFTQNALPQSELFSVTTDAAASCFLYLDVVKVA